MLLAPQKRISLQETWTKSSQLGLRQEHARLAEAVRQYLATQPPPADHPQQPVHLVDREHGRSSDR